MKKYPSLSQLHNYMSARRPTVTNLAGFMKSIMKMETPRKNWPNIARLPGDYKPPEETNFKPNLVAYQVDCVGEDYKLPPNSFPASSFISSF